MTYDHRRHTAAKICSLITDAAWTSPGLLRRDLDEVLEHLEDFVAISAGDTLIACAATHLTTAAHVFTLRSVAVRPAWQGRGLGATVVHLAEQLAAERGRHVAPHRSVLVVARATVTLTQWYARLGYHVVRDVGEVTPLGDDIAQFIRGMGPHKALIYKYLPHALA